ncbi:spermidine/putrescine ABC transporter substrate-binding protein [Synechococcus sp. H65.1]|uniref:polyamine ABC transporter substrate-binding protein n=1 Tax=unclassified Synechococcus TaxID=2626047 RepID=UPI0039C322C5
MKKGIARATALLCCLGVLLFFWPLRTAAQKQTLQLYIWSEYIDPAILTAFEKATNSRVVVSVYESNEDMIAKLRGGGVSQYDVVVPTDYVVPNMVELGLLQPLNKALIPNLRNLGEKFVGLPFDPENTYTVPYQWGTTGIGYRKDRLPENFERSWGLIFDPQQQYGPFVMIDEMRSMLAAAAFYLGFDPNTTVPSELQQIQELLIQAKRRSAGLIGGVGGKNQLVSGTANVAVVYSGDALQAAEENPNIGYFVPREGAHIWLDVMAIPAKAPNPELANRFINFLLEPEIGAQLSNYNRFATPNAAALPKINPQDRQNPAIYPDEATFARLRYLKVLSQEELRLVDAVWTAVKSS